MLQAFMDRNGKKAKNEAETSNLTSLKNQPNSGESNDQMMTEFGFAEQ